MSSEVDFSVVMRNPDSWDEYVDFDGMNDNYHILISIIDRFCFSSYPKHPKYFSLIFSNIHFARTLLEGIASRGIKDVEKVVFTEYSKEDRNKIRKMGIFDEEDAENIGFLIIYTYNKNVCFVNLFPNF